MDKNLSADLVAFFREYLDSWPEDDGAREFVVRLEAEYMGVPPEADGHRAYEFWKSLRDLILAYPDTALKVAQMRMDDIKPEHR
jgi:hypothetical protein